MIIFPAIDLKGGLCVRLMQGDPERATVYGTDPLEVARRWEEQGARWLHIVDLDGAFSGMPGNFHVVASIARSLTIPVQVGGGIRTLQAMEEYLSLGVRRIILGTVALREPALLEEACRRFPRKIAVGIDARDGMVAVEGWKETTRTQAVQLIARLDSLPLSAVIYTDIHRDGMRSGVNLEATRRLLESTSLPVIASGGVATLGDIEALLPLVPLGLEGVITGKALYSGTLNLREALARVDSRPASSVRNPKGDK